MVSRYGYGWRPYVPMALRLARARQKMEKLRKKGLDVQPVEIQGRKIARTFWGEAWCDHLESFSDYKNRLPRGRTYVRNGSVCHLEVAKGQVKAMVSGSEIYNVKIAIKTLSRQKWADVRKRCAGQVGSLLELLQGRLSTSVMSVVTDRNQGLFPLPRDISLNCDCPDWAVMCKHVAAVLYGVGARLDDQPEMLFLLRGVDHEELISTEAGAVTAATAGTKDGRRRIADDDLADVFGIDLSEDELPAKVQPTRRRKTAGPKSKNLNTDASMTARRKGKGDKERPQVKRTRASKKAIAKKAPRAAPNGRPVTGKAVVRLRAKFSMSPSQLARLLGVSTGSIRNWESNPGTLSLQQRTHDAWSAVKGLTKRQAWQKLDGS